MAEILIRDIDDGVHHKLRAMAERRSESLEALVRNLLWRAVYGRSRDDKSLGTALAERFADCGLRDGEAIPEYKGAAVRNVKFD